MARDYAKPKARHAPRARDDRRARYTARSPSRIEISSAAAVGEVQKLMSDKINEAYKEGQRDAHRLMKEMRSFFP